jgi:hypoxanthine phosphoribosyltransferase
MILASRPCNGFEYIVPVVPGGLVPATVLSQHMGSIPIVPVVFSSVFGLDAKKSNLFTDIREELAYITNTKIETPVILVVDDICNTGKRIDAVCDFYRGTGHEVWSCALYHRPSTDTVFSPSFFGERVKEGTVIHFPWEKES